MRRAKSRRTIYSPKQALAGLTLIDEHRTGGTPGARWLRLDRYRPSLICIEAHADLAQWLLDYFAGQDYALVNKDPHVHNENFFFAPLIKK